MLHVAARDFPSLSRYVLTAVNEKIVRDFPLEGEHE
jgi:hypothetical protein